MVDAEIFLAGAAGGAGAAADPGIDRDACAGRDAAASGPARSITPAISWPSVNGSVRPARDVELLAVAEREIAVLHVQVGMADAAALDAHQHLAARGLGTVGDGLAQRRADRR